MWTNRISQTAAVMMLATVVAFFGSPTEAWAHGPHGSHSKKRSTNSGRDHADHDHGAAVQRPSIAAQPGHGGQMAKGQYHHFEVVYHPRETRVYQSWFRA